MLKSDLRQQVLALLKSQDSVVKGKLDKALISQLLQHPAYQTVETVATYLPMPFEVDTSELLAHALAQGKRVLVPKVIAKGQMIFVDYDAERLVRSPFGILEPVSSQAVAPEAIDLIHVPAVAFNADGYRIGFGGGYYDRYLETFKGWTIGTAYPIQQVVFTPDEHDVAVREVICHENLFET